MCLSYSISAVNVCLHLHGDVVSGCQLLADGSQRGLIQFSDAAVEHLNSIFTLPLARGVVSATATSKRQPWILMSGSG